MSFVLAILAGGCGPDAARFTDTLFAPSVDLPVLVAAGDIASCASSGDEATADLLATVDGTVITLGDNAYEQGSAENYRECYDPTWGRFKHRTLPIPGNHEYEIEGAEGYFDYFGDAAGDPSEGYYSYDLAGWHIVALNSNECLQIGGCQFALHRSDGSRPTSQPTRTKPAPWPTCTTRASVPGRYTAAPPR